MKWIIKMSKVYILFFCLVGCTSGNYWLKNGSAAYDINELESVLVLCDYKAKMRTSNELMMRSNNTPPSRVLSTDQNNIESDRNEKILLKDENKIKANFEEKQRSVKVGKAAYSCMKKNGFEKK